jgi:hypothetical protein
MKPVPGAKKKRGKKRAVGFLAVLAGAFAVTSVARWSPPDPAASSVTDSLRSAVLARRQESGPGPSPVPVQVEPTGGGSGGGVDRCGKHGRLRASNGSGEPPLCLCTATYTGATCSATVHLSPALHAFPMSNFSAAFEGDIVINKATVRREGQACSTP